MWALVMLSAIQTLCQQAQNNFNFKLRHVLLELCEGDPGQLADQDQQNLYKNFLIMTRGGLPVLTPGTSTPLRKVKAVPASTFEWGPEVEREACTSFRQKLSKFHRGEYLPTHVVPLP